jgi:hypothetical protein
VAAAQTGAAKSPYGIEFVHENYTGGVLNRLVEQVAYTRRAYPYEHLDEVGTGYRQEGYARFAGNGFRE